MENNIKYNKRPNQHLLDNLEKKGLISKRCLNNVKFSDGLWEYYLSPSYYSDLSAKGILEEQDKRDAKDWFKVCELGTKDRKYGSIMFSPSLELMRRQDILEFYGSGIVD